MKEIIFIVTSLPNFEEANKMSYTLIDKRLAACVNIIPFIRSIYKWEGKIRNVAEILLLIKSTKVRYSELEIMINKIHPYKVPEIISIPITHGLSTYLDWIITETKIE